MRDEEGLEPFLKLREETRSFLHPSSLLTTLAFVNM